MPLLVQDGVATTAQSGPRNPKLMAKKKLSRDQKRKLKKQKRKQRKKQQPDRPQLEDMTQPIAKTEPDEAQMIEVMPPEVQMSEFDDPQFDRIRQVFDTVEIPSVQADTLQTYFNYIQENIEVPCLLTGIESMGYFGWEERYSFGFGSKTEYEKLRKDRASFQDQYELEEFKATLEADWDILVNVRRIVDGKRFTIPLSELQAVDETSQNSQLLNDYTVWFVNWP
jgi:hypothetical protein